MKDKMDQERRQQEAKERAERDEKESWSILDGNATNLASS